MSKTIELFEKDVLKFNIADSNSKTKQLFELSGTRFLLDKVSENIKEFGPQLVFIEHSYFSTTLHQKDYRVYVGIHDYNGNTNKETLKKIEYFFSTMNDKFEKSYPILFHPKFIKKNNNNFIIATKIKNESFKPNKFISCKKNDCSTCPTNMKCVIKFNECNKNYNFGEYNTKLDYLDRLNNFQNNVKKTNINKNLEKLKWCYDEIFRPSEKCFSYKYAIPISGTPAKTQYRGKEITVYIQGSVWVYFITEKPINDNKLHTTIAQKISTLVHEYSINQIFASGLELVEEVRLQATRAAISQVMARNMSHNIGSHVLSKLVTENQIMAKKIKPTHCQCKSLDQDVKDKFSKEKFIADFFNYLKSRMDYLADVTTNTPVIENVNSLYSNIISPFIQNRVLNDRISGISNFDYEVILCKPQNADKCIENDTDNCLCKILEGNDIPVSIPNDVVGVHAFYTILENIIRNTAKHAKKPENGNVEFKIKIEEASKYQSYNEKIEWNAYYSVSIFDNCPIEGEIVLNTLGDEDVNKQELQSKYNEIIEKGKLTNLQKLVFDQNIKLNETILEDNKLRHSHWGLIEMDASAAYLRKLPVEQIDSDEYDIIDFSGKNPITKGDKLVIFQAYNEQDKYLGYRFFLRKPQEILIIADNDELTVKDETIVNEDLINKLKNDGIWIYSKKVFETLLKENKIFPQKLIVVVNDKSNGEIFNMINNNPCFSKRILQRDSILDLSKDLKSVLWEEYYKQICFEKIWNIFKGEYSDHGNNYCCFKTSGNQFIEIRYSAVDHFFSNKSINKIPEYKYSWPVKIAVIDERIQSFCTESYSIQEKTKNCQCKDNKNKLLYSEIYEKTNIKVPDAKNGANLNAQNFDNENFTKIVNFVKLDCDCCEFIVIHMGIIEKLIASYNMAKSTKYNKDDPANISSFIKEVLDIKDNKYDSLIITSGRGKPQNLPYDVRYISFSVVSQYMITLRNKYAFTEALYSARKQN